MIENHKVLPKNEILSLKEAQNINLFCNNQTNLVKVNNLFYLIARNQKIKINNVDAFF
jgi:hypothetical protein